MSTEVEICKLSLAHLGDKAAITAIDPPDGSVQAAHCAVFYPLARDTLLEEYAWSFAVRREALTDIGTPTGGWGYRFSLPTDVLKRLKLSIPDASAPLRFAIETSLADGTYLLTDVDSVELTYIAQITDTTKYSNLFVLTLSWLLASYLAGPVARKPKVQGEMYQAYLNFLGKAKEADANAEKDAGPDVTLASYVPSPIRARY